MLRQLWEVAKTVIIASYRKNIIFASWLVMLPLLLAAWLFEKANPGFQSGFILDSGSGLMAIASIILLGVLGFEHLFWPGEQPTPWFYFSRLNSRIIFPAGKFVGISIVLLSILIDFAIMLFLLVGLTSDTWMILPFKMAVMVWAEYSLLFSVFVFLTTFLSRLMSVGMMIPVFFTAYSTSYLKTFLPNAVAEVVLAFIPNAGVFDAVIESADLFAFFAAILYSIIMSIFYIVLAGYSLRSIDL